MITHVYNVYQMKDQEQHEQHKVNNKNKHDNGARKKGGKKSAQKVNLVVFTFEMNYKKLTNDIHTYILYVWGLTIKMTMIQA